MMQACHWKAHNTFTNFYLKYLNWSDNDPSPQTAHPRKEKDGGGGGGGAHPLQPSLQESNPRV